MGTPSLRASRLLLLSLMGLTAAPQAGHCAWPHDPTVNVQIAPTTSSQLVNAIIPDGAGGAIIAWADNRGGTYDIYAQRLASSSATAPGWPATGLLVCGAAGDQFNPVMVSDGAGGAIIAWADPRSGGANRDIYAMRVNGNGTLGVGWPANGLLLSVVSELKDEQNPEITTDGAGGAIVTWELVFTNPTDIDVYAARATSAGTVAWSGSIVAPLGVQNAVGIASDGAGGAIIDYEDNGAGNYDIKAVRVTGSGGTLWGAVVCNDPSDQQFPQVVSDGAGGAIICWTDTRNGTNDIYALGLAASGARAAGWANNGNPVASGAGSQQSSAIVSDGNHGALIAWLDSRFASIDVFTQHMLGTGAAAPGWPVNGVEVIPSGTGNAPVIASDGAGGAIVSWYDSRNGLLFGEDIYASRITSTGTLGPGWAYGGTPISVAANGQTLPVLASDGSGGAILAWNDARGPSSGCYAQLVDHLGQLGNAEPTIASIGDVGGDQGGHVRIVWNSSYLDADPIYAIGAYWIWRQAPVTAAAAAVARGGAWLDARLESLAAQASPADWAAIASHGIYTTTTQAGTTIAWEYLVSLPASGFSQYSYVAPTTRDSLPGSNPYTLFMVQARAPSGPAFWNSAADSGYSVDNLPPLAPAPFTGAYLAGSTRLYWGPNQESDFAVYRLYRGSSAGFVPGPSNFVVEKPDTGYIDAPGPPVYYKLAAVDTHGNLSAYALLTPSGTLGAPPEGLPKALWLGAVTPNPTPGDAALRFALPRASTVSLRIFDASGRVVRELANGTLPAGDHISHWDSRASDGSKAASGVYFVELVAEGRTLRGRFVSMR